MVNGQTYFYLREMARIDGKPKIVSQRYLGKASDIEAAMDGAMGVPERTRHLGFGDIAAVWSMLERLDVAGIIDDVVGARRSDASVSVGTYICLTTLNRIVAPCSKLGFADWWATTAGDRWIPMPKAALDDRRFWAAMDSIDADMLVEIERRIGAGMVAEFGLDLSALVLDMTNLATYIDTTNTRAPIAQRGRAKQKRSDLRLVGLGLVVTRYGGIPLCSHTSDRLPVGLVLRQRLTRRASRRMPARGIARSGGSGSTSPRNGTARFTAHARRVAQSGADRASQDS